MGLVSERKRHPTLLRNDALKWMPDFQSFFMPALISQAKVAVAIMAWVWAGGVAGTSRHRRRWRVQNIIRASLYLNVVINVPPIVIKHSNHPTAIRDPILG